MPGCCAVNCRNRSEEGFRLFKIPRNEPRRSVWIRRIRRANWQSTMSARLCEAHFEDGAYEPHTADGKKLLKPNAVPTLFSYPPLQKRKNQKRRRGDISDLNNNQVDKLSLLSVTRDHMYPKGASMSLRTSPLETNITSNGRDELEHIDPPKVHPLVNNPESLVSMCLQAVWEKSFSTVKFSS